MGTYQPESPEQITHARFERTNPRVNRKPFTVKRGSASENNPEWERRRKYTLKGAYTLLRQLSMEGRVITSFEPPSLEAEINNYQPPVNPSL